MKSHSENSVLEFISLSQRFISQVQGMANKRDISAEEQALFRAHVADVTPLQDDRAQHTDIRPRPSTRRQQNEAPAIADDLFSDETAPDELQGDEVLFFSRSGVQHNVLRRLRRGQYVIAAELDLHGLRAEEARQELSLFLHHCRARRLQCVRIIHGKGYRSEQNQPVLKGKVNHWLRQRPEVLAFCSALPSDGGTGALYLLLKRK